ncbi:MAG TPA: CBS domain-containing protein [Plasticicumulans sp.]|uniref:CBS domain-containing protein n=1 Tax=Plasticicumulans sp. TaxID=2307179 RepID=UPI000FBA01AB|nr:CBS domain-containing protein [Plasticicumulans sp.]MBS0602869.1 CBS domain-containing protein [Pseudomonadota bacterium]RTK97892.1 MAG: CBS domain-containing protein [Xanthomonadales bacterium]HMV39897.1 CBS domain-containing protein [Plasticicumulans sp.]HMW28667.1 CBS domain-containing protein [Plasticicumulans sp.]HMW42377.1 CBS domain-containing protein [Plasticicumulans sp.]
MPNRPVREVIANQTILTAPAAISVSEAAVRMKESRVGAVMVVETDGALSGIFTERDALFRVLAAGLDPKTTKLAEVMTPHPQTIAPERPFGHALHMMYECGFRHVPVIDAGKPIGMVSARDALGPELAVFQTEVQQREHIEEIL